VRAVTYWQYTVYFAFSRAIIIASRGASKYCLQPRIVFVRATKLRLWLGGQVLLRPQMAARLNPKGPSRREQPMRQKVKLVVVMLVFMLVVIINTRGAALQSGEVSGRNPLAKNPSAIRAGKQRFVTNCGACHGSSAAGGRGAKLAGSRRVQDMADNKVFEIIRNGVPGTDMPSNRLADQEIWEIVAFIRSLNARAADQFVPGDSANGKTLFFGAANCSTCHSIAGRGGSLGPDLSDIASLQSVENIKQAIVAPSQFIEPGFAAVVVVTASGKRIEGIVKNESSYSLQLQDLEGNFHSISKSDVSEIMRRRESLMPAVSLSHQQLQDILAFLSRQKGANASPIEPEGRQDL
jgi:cytochrome c oxidase cbb3-type subunit III